MAIVDESSKLMYVSIPKAANSAVKRLFWVANGWPADKKIDAIHTVDPEIVPFRQFDDYTEAELRRVLTGGDYFRFTFVRNPYTRIQSAYKNKILNPATEKKRASFLKKLNWNKNTLPEFGDFLDIIRTQKELKMDWHWMPQTRLALIDMIDYHLIGKQESFSQEIAPVYERLRLEVEDWPNLIGTPINQTTEEKVVILNPIDAEKVWDIYRADFDTFGYDSTDYQRK